MKFVIQRGNQNFGPYPRAIVERYLAQGTLLPQDLARQEGARPSDNLPLAQLLSLTGSGSPVPSPGNPFQIAWNNLKSFDIRLLFPWKTISSLSWTQDRRLINLAAVGLSPAVALACAPGVRSAYWAVALYFSVLWALFFFYLFRTNQVRSGLCVLCFCFTGIVSISILLLIQGIPPWKILLAMTRSDAFLTRLFAMFFGVAINEELCKAVILFWLVRRPGNLLIPQTVVLYGMISGLGFGIYEGVGYQMSINRDQGVDGAYLLNIARLTSLPFLHAVWTGMAGYFISFSALYPRKRYGLWVIAIGAPASFHTIYNTFGWGFIGLGSALLSVILLTTYLTSATQLQRNLAAP